MLLHMLVIRQTGSYPRQAYEYEFPLSINCQYYYLIRTTGAAREAVQEYHTVQCRGTSRRRGHRHGTLQ